MVKMEMDNMKRHFEYLFIGLKISFRRVIEYKFNFIIYFFEHLFHLIGSFFFISVLFALIGDTITWSFNDYALFFVLSDWIIAFGGLIAWRGRGLDNDIIGGHLNVFLLRPINPYVGHLGFGHNFALMFFVILNPIVHCLILLYLGVGVNNILIGIIFWLLVVLLFILYFEFILSLNFIKLKITNAIDPFVEVVTFRVGIVYPLIFFRNSYMKILMLFATPVVFIGSLVVPILRGYEIWNLELQLLILFSLIILFSLGTWFNWSYGLKKYEAYG